MEITAKPIMSKKDRVHMELQKYDEKMQLMKRRMEDKKQLLDEDSEEDDL